MTGERLYAVLTGDIVRSARFVEQGPAIGGLIREAYGAAEEAFTDAVGGIDVFRGDSWQMLVRRPALALRIGLLMKALIRSNEELPDVDTRVAIGVGSVAYVDEENLSESQGEAFTLSGEALDGLQDSKVRIAVKVPMTWAERDVLLDPQATLDTMMALLDAIASEWTAAMAGAIAGKARHLTQQEIAEMTQVSQPAISKALIAGHWGAIERQLLWWESTFASMER